MRHIIGKSSMTMLKSHVLKVTGYQHICAGLESGCEEAVHAVVDLFEKDTTHGFMQIGANYAFNSMKQTLLLHNVKVLCPKIATYLNSCYMKPLKTVYYRWERDLVKGKNHSRRSSSNGDACYLNQVSFIVTNN